MIDKEFKLIKFQPKRTFGIELEFPSQYGRDFLKNCLRDLGEPAIAAEWRHDNNNREWVCKTDSSCGYEVASKVLGSTRSIRRTLSDLKLAVKVCKAFKDHGATVTDRCGTHVHVWVGDFNSQQLLNLLAYWVKFEKTIVDMMPEVRKRNSFCPCPSGFLQPNVKFNFNDLLRRGFHQRGSLNWGWYDQRGTVEFRIAEGTVDPNMLKNWLRFLLYFVEKVKTWPDPENVNWLTFDESLDLLELHNLDDPDDREQFRILSPALAELRAWILQRTHEYAGYRDAGEMKQKTAEMIQVVA